MSLGNCVALSGGWLSRSAGSMRRVRSLNSKCGGDSQ